MRSLAGVNPRSEEGPVTARKLHHLAVYTGVFDPVHFGHLDVIHRGSSLFDHLIVAVLINTQKQPLFPVEDRLIMIREAVAGFGNVEADAFTGLTVEYAACRNANLILRGIRAISDYEAELQIAHLNRRMRPETETVFLLAAEEFALVSSRMIKEIFTLGGDVAQFVPEPVLRRLRAKP